jgi:ribosomal protein S18 acetylase RimI-like enzyme
VAIAPEFQGRGFASRLLRPRLTEAEERGEPVFLETHNPRNLLIYEKYGFRIILKQEIGKSGIQHYCLLKK